MSRSPNLLVIFFALLMLRCSQSQRFDPLHPPIERFPFLRYASLYQIVYYWTPQLENTNPNPLKKDNDAIIAKFHYPDNITFNSSFQKPPSNVNILSFTEHQPFDRTHNGLYPLKLQYKWMKKKITRLFNPVLNESIPNVNVSGYILRNVFNNRSSNFLNNNTIYTGQVQEVPLFKITGTKRDLTRAQYSFIRGFDLGAVQALPQTNKRPFRLLTRGFISNQTTSGKLQLNYTFFFETNKDYAVSTVKMREKPRQDSFATRGKIKMQYVAPPVNLTLPKNPYRFLNDFEVCIARLIQIGFRIMPEIIKGLQRESYNGFYHKLANISAYELANNEGTQLYFHYRILHQEDYYTALSDYVDATINGTCIKKNGVYQHIPLNLTGSFTNYVLVQK